MGKRHRFIDQFFTTKGKPIALSSLFLLFCLISLSISGCPSDKTDSSDASNTASTGSEDPSVKADFHTTIDERETIHPANSVVGIHKFEDYPKDTPFVAGTSTNGRLVFFVDRSSNPDRFAVYSVEMPGGKPAEAFEIPSVPEKLVVSLNGMTVFALCKEGGFLYSVNEHKLFARIDYDYSKEAQGISPDGMVFSCWGGEDKTPYNYTRYFDSLTSTAFWETPAPSSRENVYGCDPVVMLPSFGLTQMIVQVGDLTNPAFTFVTMNIHQHGYKATESISGFLTAGVVSKDGLVYRSLYSPPESSLAKSTDGKIPYTHRAIIDLKGLGFSLEPLKTIITGAPLALDRMVEHYLAKTDSGDIEVRSLETNKPVYAVANKLIDDSEILAWSSDLQGVLVVADNELRWIDMTRFQVGGE